MADPIFSELERIRKEENVAKSTLYRGAQQDPDAAARRAQLARRLKTSTSIVSADESRLVSEDRARRVSSEYDEARQTAVTRFLLDKPEHAEVSHDDITLLNRLGNWFTRNLPDIATFAFQGPGAAANNIVARNRKRNTEGLIEGYKAGDWNLKNFGQAFKAGAARIEQGARGLDQLVVEAIAPDSALADYTRKRSREWSAYTEGLRPRTKTRFAQDVLSGVESVPSSLFAAGATIATGNPYVGATFLGATTGGSSYSGAREEGLGVGKAAAKGAIDAVIETGTELLGQKYLAADTAANASFRQFVWDQIKAEVPGEQAATLGQNFNQWAMIDQNKGKDFGDFLAEIPDNAWSTLVATAVTVGGVSTSATLASRVARRFNKRDESMLAAAEDNEQIAEMMKLAEASKLRERDPVSFERFLEIASEDGDVSEVFVEPGALQEVLNQSALEPEQQIAIATAFGPRLEEALEEGTDVRIPVAELATVAAGTPVGEALLNHIKTDPNGMSRLEAEQYMQERGDALKAEIEKVLADKEQDEAFQSSTETVKAEVLRQLNEANRFTPSVNESYATMHGAFYATMAARLGSTPEELYKRYPLRIQNQNIEGTRFEQAARDLTQTEEFKNWFRGSKVVDEKGEPLVVYHGTNADFEAFDNTKTGQNDRGLWGRGHYFSAVVDNANSYALRQGDGAKVIPAYVSLKNPLVLNTGEDLIIRLPDGTNTRDLVGPNLDGSKIKEIAQSAGHDGVVQIKPDGQIGDIVAFEPTQIKSIFNRGTFDPNDPNILNQSPVFFSPLEKAVEGIGLTKADGRQWLATIQKTPGVKKEELEWTGLPEWLTEQSGAITKEEVLAFVKAGGIQVEEIVKSDDPYENEIERGNLEYEYQQEDFEAEFQYQSAQIDVEDDFDRQTIDMFDPDYVRPFAKTWEARVYFPTNWNMNEKAIAEATGGVFDPTDDGSYVLGVFDTEEEMREAVDKAKDALFDRLTDNDYFEDARRRAEEKFAPQFREYVTNPNQGEDYTELLLTLPKGAGGNPEDVYKGGHWDEENVVAHIRFDKRTDAEGETVLMIHEIQSDWHQTGRDRGYRTAISAEEKARLEKEIADAEADIAEIKARPDYAEWMAEMNAADKAVDEAAQETRSILSEYGVDYFIGPAELRRISGMSSSMEGAVEYATSQATARYVTAVREKGENPHGVTEQNVIDAIRDWYDADKREGDAREIRNRLLNKPVPSRLDLQNAEDRRNSARTKLSNTQGVPDAPFKNTGYASLALKRVIRWAADQGDIDKIAWIRGEQQNGWQDGAGAWFYNETNVGKDGKERPGVLLSVAKDVLKKIGSDAKIERFYNIDGMEPDGARITDPKEFQAVLKLNQDLLAEAEANGDEARASDLRDVIETIKEQLETAETDFGHLGFRLTGEMEEAARQGFALFQTNRGAYAPATDTITLLKSADLSTFLHESGHFYLEMLDRLAEDQSAPQDIRDDFNTVLKWFGVKDAVTWRGMTLEQKRKHHEKFARGFEAYLFSGKSPSIRLQGLFQKFRAWLIAVYKKARNLDVTVSEPVRGVMDRLLATATEIQEAEAARSMFPLFESPEQSGMTPDQWRSYQELGNAATQDAIRDLETRSLRDMRWLNNAKGREVNRLKKQAKLTRARVREEVSREVLAEPVYRAEQFLKKGTVDGVKVEGPHKLYTPEIRAEYGEEAAALVEQLRGMTSTENGINPQQVAEMFGFSSVDHMLVELTSAEPMKDKIDGLTEQRLLEEFGDLVDEDSINRAADKAIHNEARTRFVATELAALSKATGKQGVLSSAAKQFARETIDRQRVRDIRPAKYEAAAARAAKKAMDAIAKGDTVSAAAEKRNQLINMHAARAARAALEDAEKSANYLKKFDRPGVAKKLDPDYLDQIHALLEAVELRRVTNRALDRRSSLTAWIERQREQGFEPVISEELLDSLTRKNFRDMTVEELRGLIDSVRNIEHLGRLKNRLLTAKRDKDFATAVGKVVDTIRFNATRNYPPELERRGFVASAKKGAGEFLAMHRKFSSLVREMDGHQDGGDVWEVFVRPMNAAGDREAVMRAEATQRLAEILKPVSGRKAGRKVYIPEIGTSLSLEARLAIALNQGNAVNRERVMSGEMWDEDQIAAINETLTAEEWNVVQQLWDFVGSYWPEIAAKERRVTGVEPERVDAEPLQVVTKDGVILDLAGGYYPIKYNTDRSSVSEAHDAAEIAKQALRGAYTSATTRRGHTKARVESTGRALRYDLGVVVEHVNQVVHDLVWHEWLIDANRLLRANAIDSAVRDHYGSETLRAMRKAFEDIAAGDIPAANVFERSLQHLRTGVTISFMGWSLQTGLLQPLGLTQSIKRIGPKWVARGLSRWLGDTAKMQNTVKWVQEQSEFMRTRGLTQSRELNEIRNQISAKPQALQAVEASFFVLIQKLQLIADIPTWVGQYEKSMAKGETHDRAVALADQAVLDAQGGGQIKDLAAIQRGGPMLKLWTNFYSYFNTSYNLLAESVNETRLVGPKRLPLLAVDVLLVLYLPATLAFILRSTLRGDDDEPEEFAAKLAKENIAATFGLMVGAREIGSIIQSDGRAQAPAGLVLKQFADVYKQAAQGEADEQFWRAVNNAAGVLFHYPALQIDRTVRGIEAIANGETSNPMAVLLGPPK